MFEWLFTSLHRKLDYIITLVERLVAQGAKIMGLQEDMQAELVSINASTTSIGNSIGNLATSNADIAADLDDLIAHLPASGGLSEAQAQALLTSLKEGSATLKSNAEALTSTSEALVQTAAKWTPTP